jgi:hypothetical protein
MPSLSLVSFQLYWLEAVKASREQKNINLDVCVFHIEIL